MPYSAVPNFVDHLPLWRARSKAHKLLYVGQLIDRKGLAPFIDALVRWSTRHPQRFVEFDIAGSGPLESALPIKLPPNLNIRFLGRLRMFAQLADCYATAGILAFPTLSDEWGLVTNEAMAAGLPVLGSVYSQAVDELCVEGQTGWRFRTDVSEEMDIAIDRALSTPVDELDRMQRAGREAVSQLTPPHIAERFLSTIRAAAAGSHPRSTVNDGRGEST